MTAADDLKTVLLDAAKGISLDAASAFAEEAPEFRARGDALARSAADSARDILSGSIDSERAQANLKRIADGIASEIITAGMHGRILALSILKARLTTVIDVVTKLVPLALA